MLIKKWMILPVTALMISAAPALAEEGRSMMKMHGGDRGGHMMKEADTDNDGVVTKSEFLAAHEKKFTEIDKDGDGKITEEDIKAHMEAKRQKKKDEWFDKADTDGDGKLSREELDAHKMKMKNKMMEHRNGGMMMDDDGDDSSGE